MHLGLYLCLTLADRGEKPHSKPLYLHFLWTFFSIQTCVTTGLIYTCKRIFQTSVRKLRNQCKHQQFCVNFQFCLHRRSEKSAIKGSKSAHWIGLYLSFHLSWIFGPFVHGRLQNLKTSENMLGHDIALSISSAVTNSCFRMFREPSSWFCQLI